MDLPRSYNAATDLLHRHVAEGRGDRIAVIDDDGRTTYAELAARADRAAGALRDLGVQPEQRVALVMLDGVDFVATFLGAIRLGAVPVPLNTLLAADDYVHLLRDSRARVLIASDALIGKLAPAIAGAPALLRALDASAWRARIATAAPIAAPADTTPDDVAFWLYSSGSTGKPKGAMHLHRSPRATVELYAQAILGIAADDVVFSAAKLFFAYGLGNALVFPLAVGATAVLTAERPTVATVARVMATHQPTIFGGVPTLFASLLADASFAPSPRLRVSTSAGEALPKHVGERWRARTGTDVLDGIGSTEMLHIFLSNRPGDVVYGTTGRPVPGYDLELRGDHGAVLSGAAEGALWVRGPSACSGYWNDRARTLATFHGAWTRTGDRYARADDGTWTYCGRDDDMLKVGGIWVSPFEVESALAAHPAVLEAAVIGAQDADGLTKPKAYVVLRDRGAAAPAGLVDELKAFVKAAARAVQVSALDRRGRRAAEDRDRQDPALQAARGAVTFLDVDGVRLEAAWIGEPAARALVFLHEGLGSITQWRETPAAIAATCDLPALVYARAGYGRSTPIALPRPRSYMHDEAARLPAILAAAGVREPVLVGHSDGASIAIIAAASGGVRVRGLVLIAPHVFVEDISVASIAAAAQTYLHGDLRARLAKHHADVDGAFWGWNRAWLDPDFRAWNLEVLLPHVRVRTLVVQGEDDAYGTRAQVDAIATQLGAPCEVAMIADAGHAPFRDHPAVVHARIAAFVASLG